RGGRTRALAHKGLTSGGPARLSVRAGAEGLASGVPAVGVKSRTLGGYVKASRWIALAAVGLLAVSLTATGALGSGRAHKAPQATIKVALVSDIGKFNDKSFNQLQLEGLKRAKTLLGINILPLQSNSVSDYLPNFNTAVRQGSNLVIAAGFLLADNMETMATQFPKTK